MCEYGNSRERNSTKLITVAKEIATGAAWKRLGYIAELLWPKENILIDEARKHLTTGNAKLDPTVRKKGTLVRRWRLWVNADISVGTNES
jgi:predicted transcriptional regulator of viral defense system